MGGTMEVYKVVIISDTHCIEIDEVPDCDILIHCGDLTFEGSEEQIGSALRWLSKLPGQHKILVAGNHDWLFERDAKTATEMCDELGITYLMDRLIEVCGIRIYGSPWQPEFFQWAFNLPRGEPLAEKWDKIPENTDILITHGPPIKVLDFVPKSGFHVGCEELKKVVDKIKPAVHAFGHIHEGYGVEVIDKTMFINASICDEKYKPINKPIEIEIFKSFSGFKARRFEAD